MMYTEKSDLSMASDLPREAVAHKQVCTCYHYLPVMAIHPLHSPPPDCSAVSNSIERAQNYAPDPSLTRFTCM